MFVTCTVLRSTLVTNQKEKEKENCSHGQGIVPHSSPPEVTSQQSYQDFCVVELFSHDDSFCTLVR